MSFANALSKRTMLRIVRDPPPDAVRAAQQVLSRSRVFRRFLKGTAKWIKNRVTRWCHVS
jgi:hypothetical protein